MRQYGTSPKPWGGYVLRRCWALLWLLLFHYCFVVAGVHPCWPRGPVSLSDLGHVVCQASLAQGRMMLATRPRTRYERGCWSGRIRKTTERTGSRFVQNRGSCESKKDA